MSYEELKLAVEFAENHLASGLSGDIGVGWKKTNGEYIRGEKSIVFHVREKKPLSELLENEIIPPSITLDGVTFKTDVVQDLPMTLYSCYPFRTNADGSYRDAAVLDNTIRDMRWNFTHNNQLNASNYPAGAIGRIYTDAASGLMGGTQVIKWPDNYTGGLNNANQYVATYSVGTMGFIAVDNEDERIVGVTNTHVACDRKLKNTDRFKNDFFLAAEGIVYSGELADPYSLVHRRPRNIGKSNSSRIYNDADGNPFTLSEPPGTFPPQLVIRTWEYVNAQTIAQQQMPPLASDSTLIETRELEDPLYSYEKNTNAFMLKRYSPFSVGTGTNINNTVDCCIFDIDDRFLEDYSYKLREPDGDMDMVGEYLEFATTTELNNMLINPPAAIRSVGRTTGPKGFFATHIGGTSSCEMEIVEINRVTGVGFTEKGQRADSRFTNLLAVEYVDDSPFPSAGGDSGSCVIADLTGNGDFKVIGLHFAGNGLTGSVIRIDEIVSRMNIRAWTGATSVDTSRPSGTVVTRPYTQGSPDQETITIDGHTYYNVGLAHSKRVITQYGHSITTQNNDTIVYEDYTLYE